MNEGGKEEGIGRGIGGERCQYWQQPGLWETAEMRCQKTVEKFRIPCLFIINWQPDQRYESEGV